VNIGIAINVIYSKIQTIQFPSVQ